MSGVDRRDFLKTATLAATMGAVSARAPAAAQDAPAVESRGPRVLAPYETYVHNGLVDQNTFIHAPREESDLPTFEASRSLLPDPIWEGHSAAIDCYWNTWELAFANLRRPHSESGFVSNYIDTAFNDCIFMWDSCFILMFGRYGSRAFDFLRTLDNFYAKQHPDGFICRENGQRLGDDRFQRFDPTSTGPNLMPWTEWEYYLNFGDKARLSRVFPVLRAYHQWLRAYRTWPDGTYWASGWACGMDNQPRLRAGEPYHHEAFYHQHMVWADTCLQQVLSAALLSRMGRELGREEDVADMAQEAEALTRVVNNDLWDPAAAYYFDRYRDGTLNGVKSIGAYWALLAGAVAPERLDGFLAHLRDKAEFDRPHRVPTLSADHPDYNAAGGYWKGSVWPPTNYMLLRGLTAVGEHDLAHEIGRNHLGNVVDVFEQTGTVFENYAPEAASSGSPARRDFVGWGGVPPIAVLLEYVLGLQADVPAGRIVWRVNLTEAHGVKRYPFGTAGWVELHCAPRTTPTQEPQITASSTVPLELQVRWPGGHGSLQIGR